MALDVSGLATLMAGDERISCKWLVCELARVGADGAYRAAAASPATTRPTPPPETRGGGGEVCAPPPQPVFGVGGLYAVLSSQLE